ncbi:DUF4328 domain-containing protein [Streptomyces sp. NBC_01387]|uniref:DUF4328 domain-containing protein n=1 Tax=unclassified Streptomyces TaxID=2593676 RepID=UPI002024D58C|nr:DUF4328 domain-containing protein [Streptomyces sp. A 4/2]WSV57391.1 DUF4328 domain-containing protein [Streptomyces sp. NBC_01014]
MNDPIAPPALRPVRGAAHCAVAAFALSGATWLVRALWQLRLAASGVPAAGPPDQGDGRHRPLTALEDSYHLVSRLGDAATALCVIAFLAWLLNARDNARTLSGKPPRYALPWVYAGWIVPIANLWVPRGIVADIHRRCAPGERLPRAVNWWWGLWLAGTLSGVGLMYTGSTDQVIARTYTDVPMLLVADAAVIGAAAAGIFVVRALTAAQQRHINGSAGNDTTTGTTD